MASANRASPEKRLWFAQLLLADLRRRCPEAQALSAKTVPDATVIGLVDEGEWVPLLRLSGGSAACNVMWLQAWQTDGWVMTGLRGTPAVLAEKLAGQYAFTWQVAVRMVGFSPTT